LLKKSPTALSDFVKKHGDLDLLFLQETKLQEQHLTDPKLPMIGLLEEDGYDAYYSCSTAKKGYSGTAAFVRRRGGAGLGASSGREGEDGKKDQKKKQKQKTLDKFFFADKKEKGVASASATAASSTAQLPFDPCYLMPESVSYGMGIDKHDSEGRVIVMDFPHFTVANVYVPNSGQNLDRLEYRTEEWDKDWVEFMKSKQQERKVPTMWVGDLNVAHTNLEVWNDGAKHLAKQAGTTQEERSSFQGQLDDYDFVDAFRKLHPTAKGHYSYWSQRAGNRPPNKGLRLDYFICDASFFDDSDGSNPDGLKIIARDSYMDYEQQGSDHCPVILELEMKEQK